jgi:hypothetical protein
MIVMPALVAGIHAFQIHRSKDVDGRDEPGHDAITAHSSGVNVPGLVASTR